LEEEDMMSRKNNISRNTVKRKINNTKADIGKTNTKKWVKLSIISMAVLAFVLTAVFVSNPVLSVAVSASHLSLNEVLRLYDEGYSLEDIKKSDELSDVLGKSPEQLLEMKGKESGLEVKRKGNRSNADLENRISKRSCKGQIL
jgi:hypothetical protein